MTLRRQLLLVSLLLFSLPWAGCQFIREMEGALRQGQEQSLQATAQAVAAVLGERSELLYPSQQRRSAPIDKRKSIYAAPTDQTVIIDGYGDGWDDVDRIRFRAAGEATAAVTVMAQTREAYLYLLLEIEDPQVVYHNPGLSQEPNGDRLVLRLWQGGERRDYVIATEAPGSVRARPGNRRQRGINPERIRGYWQDSRGGYNLELEIPLEYTGGRLGFYVINENLRSGRAVDAVGNIKPLDPVAPPWLIYSPSGISATLAPFTQRGSHIQVVDKDHWLIADLPGATVEQNSTEHTFWLLQLIYRSILSQDELTTAPAPSRPGKMQGEEISAALVGKAANRRYRDAEHQTRTTLSAAAPVADTDGVFGAVVVRQSGETYLSLTDQAFSRLLGYSLMAMGIGAFGLLGYASLLSWRIRRLSLAASRAISDEGVVTNRFPRSNAQDEIGELSRHYGDLLDKVREYNDYLRTLSRKLSHELRTPIAVIQTSLDNLEQARDQGNEADVYLLRAREGLTRLQRILTAMSEANQLEESIRNNQELELDLVSLLGEVFTAYESVYPTHALALDIEAPKALVLGVPDLIVQALDKLMDNAASFCPPGETITLRLTAVADQWQICLSNVGPLLPAGQQEHLFDPMISLRETQSDDVHLGLGLHIVRLIADFHDGRVFAGNLTDGSGVVFTLQLPAPSLQTPAA